ncbi:MAG: zf-TFIIB domain-containing protein, partial [Candidatus Muiribacteriaceae bacterium]
MKKKDVNGIEIDICDQGCGGIWFDNYELKKFDEPHEMIDEDVLNMKPKIKPTIEKKRKCPKCGDVVMLQHFFSVKRQVTVDECPACGGVWLDSGELKDIRLQYVTEEEREKAADKVFGEVFSGDMKNMRSESQAKLKKARRFAKMFKWICPSAYIPG